MTRSLYTLIIVLAVGSACGRIVATQRVYEPSLPSRWPQAKPRAMPTFSSNDRSRWATVRALVHDGSFVIGTRDPDIYRASAVAPLGQLDPLQAAVLAQAGYRARVASSQGIIFEDGYESVDKVLHPDKLEFYSSKPPLLTTLIAGLYWLLHVLFGWTLQTNPSNPLDPVDTAAVVRTILIIVNVVPFAIYLHVLSGWLERWCTETWAKLFVFLSAAFATLVSPFLITLNNHTLGTFAVFFALHAVVRIWETRQAGRTPHAGWFLLAGLCGAFAVAMELPALAFAACVGALLLFWFPGRTLLLFVPVTPAIAAVYFITNWLAVGQWAPAYSEFGGPWYEYEGSHWRRPLEGEVRRGIDWARQHESRWEYAVHALVGHHGWFSLTPIWLLALAGMIHGSLPFGRTGSPEVRHVPWFVAPLTLLVSVVVIGFYLGIVASVNYGGFTVGLRWLMWLTPLWLACLIPMAERLATCWFCRGVAYVLLGVSAVTANYSPWNPWRHPWLYDLLVAQGWWPGY
ncbi:MAG: hypothetical protein L0Y71_06375 [Gemmataceae bacterium]|nr:hypothetical protein [Gemmataceae bacterium]